jgi:drug/metabolite transporter (DMT)-like permease
MPATLSSLQVAALGVVSALLLTAGNYFQKLNGVRGAPILASGWVALATLCNVPTFFMANAVYLRGGKLSVYAPIGALTYLFTMMVGRMWFGETIRAGQAIGGVLVALGVALIARA